MDFSSLDLLASTALRDNNPTQGDSSTTSAEHHPQQNHHDSVENDEDDDEADGNRDSVEELESVASEDSIEKEMGSVKCGKHKKNSAKPMSIFVRDKKCVAQHLPADKTCHKEKRGEVTGDSNGTHPPLEVNCTEEGGNADSQNTVVHCIMTPKCPTQTEGKNSAPESSTQLCCNGVNKVHHQNTVPADEEIQQAELCLKDVSTDSQPSSVQTDQTSCDLKDRLCEKASQEQASKEQAPLEHALDSNSKETSKSVTEGGSDAVNTSVTDLSCESSQLPSGAAKSCSSKELFSSEQAEKQEGTGCCGTGILHTDRQSPDRMESVLQSGTQSDSATSELINFTVPDGTGVEKSACSDSVETAMDTKTPQICDENLAVVTCSQTEVKVKVGEQSGPCKISVDQETGSSRTKELEPSISSKTDHVKSMLSPPPPVPPPPPINIQAILADHTYCSRYKGRTLENMDDSGDAFESADENISADETERRPRSLSVDSVYLQYNVAGLSSQQESSQNDKLALLSPTLSVDSISNDSSVSEHSTPAGGQCYSILVGSPNPKGTSNRPSLAIVDNQIMGPEKLAVSADGDCRLGPSVLETGSSSSQVDISNFMAGGPKCGKFRIGTFGSFSNSHLELEKESKKSKLKNGLSDPLIKTPLPSLVMPSPGSPFPLLQSPGMEWDRSDAGSEAPDDLDSSTTEDKFLSSSHDSDTFNMTVGQVWRHPVFHDHDYCSKEVSEEYLGKPAPPAPQMKTGKRKYVKKKDRQDYEEEKLRKGKYLKRELLKQDNRFNLGGGRGMDSRIVAAKSSLLAEPFATKPNPVGRPRKRTEKQLEEYDAETGAKMKITGKYQDQYVYYLNKSSRNRRRKVDEKIPSGDKIILPAPKPGDIVVPHLSDADCEAIRHGGRNALYNSNSHPASSVPLPHTDSGDMDSSIVNTILSMETEHGNLPSPLNAYDGVGSQEDFRDIEDNLTSEQVKLLIDCLEDCQMEETTTSQELDLLTCAESVCAPSTTIDSLAGTSGEEDLMVPGVTPPLSSSAVTEPTTQLGKMDPSSPAQVNLEQEGLTCNIKTEVMEHSDMKPLVTGMPVPPPTSQPSVEKNLEFLKTPFFPESSVASSGSHELFSPSLSTSLMGPMPDSKSDDVNETPWIVTVTLYWNDIPAIVINNVPHVRLVDIHRQILPAKDTGILKKRCQLMSIQVSNCTEMQRYFLVQYGRAHNSKSTLVISKDEAQRLITYYAHPPPRNLRGEDGAGFRRSSSYAELRSIMERPSNPGRHSTLAFNQPRKRGGFRRRALPARSHNPSPEPPAPTLTPVDPLLTSPQPAAPSSSVKGLRHKKINFREMLRGEDSSSHLCPLMDGVTEEDSALPEELPAVKGRTSKPSAATGGKRRRVPKDVGGGTPAKRGRKAWRKKNEGKDGAQEVAGKQQERDIVVDKDSPGAGVGTKTKKRSPGSAAGGNLNASSRSPKSKYGLIKVNVKSLVSSGGSLSTDGSQPRKKNLFGRKSSSADVVDGSGMAVVPCKPARVLRISHQDVEATSLPVSQTPSPTAEVHLDLYKQASSPCVKCRMCQEFLSVADFLKHQHVSGVEVVKGSTVHTNLAPSHPRRILVPLNKENISLEEQRLWNEFVALQESLDCTIGVASMGAYPLTPLSPASPIGSSLNMFGDAHSLAVDELHLMTPESPYPASASNGRDGDDTVLNSEAVAPAVTVVAENHAASPSSAELPTASHPVNTADVSLSAEGAKCAWDSQLLGSPLAPPFPTTHTQNEEKCFVNNSGEPEDRAIQSRPKTVSSSNKKQWPLQRPRKMSPVTSVRTSSRKRETKRLYSFEKYEFAVGGKKGGRGETDTQDMEDDLRDTLLDVNSVAASGTILHLASATTLMHEPQNN